MSLAVAAQQIRLVEFGLMVHHSYYRQLKLESGCRHYAATTLCRFWPLFQAALKDPAALLDLLYSAVFRNQ